MATEFNYTREWTDAEAFPLLSFTKNWENPEDYPTYEPDETQVRKDMQSLHDEVKNFLNNELIPRVVEEDATVEAWNAAEKARQEAEANRVLSEDSRASAESYRELAEASRVQAEAGRTSREQTRETNEEGRKTAEVRREEAEAARETNEIARKQAEGNRSLAEGQRAAAEQARREAEEIRQAKEQERDDAERGRAADEATRRDSEAHRVEAENARNLNEAERQRVEALRVEVDSMREIAEVARQQAEQGRKTAEETRKTNESARVNAEEKRAENEQERRREHTEMTNAEFDRAEAERLRKQAETNREENETKRAAAESTRDRTFTQMKNLIENLDAEAQTLEAGEEATVDVTVDQKTGGYKIQFGLPRGYDGEGSGDMIAAVYDKHGKKQDVFEYADGKIAKTDIVQGTGKSTEAVMSQKAVTDALSELSNYATPQMFGAVGDGVTDDTAAIQAALDAYSFVYIPDGTYMINATYAGYGYVQNGGIKPRTGQTIIMSNNATLKAIASETSFYNIINLFQVSDVLIQGGKVQGDRTYHPGTDGEHGHGIAIRACENVTIDNVESFDCWGDSIDIGYYGETNCHNIRIYNCRLHDSRRQAISITGASGVIVRDCELYNINGTAPQSGIDIEPDGETGYAKDITVDSCKFYNNVGTDILIAPVTNTINSVKILNCIAETLHIVNCDDTVIYNNTVDSLTLACKWMSVSNCNMKYLLVSAGNGVFTNCNIKPSDSGSAIGLDGSDYPDKVIEEIHFDNCNFSVVAGTAYLMKSSNVSYVDGLYPFKKLKFTSCSFTIPENCEFASRLPEEFILNDCELNFEWAPYEMFYSKSWKGTKIVMRNTIVNCEGKPSYLMGVANFGDYAIELVNNVFPNFAKFLYCSSGGASGGTIRLINNVMSNATIYNTNMFDVSVMNSIGDIINAIPVYKGGVS